MKKISVLLFTFCLTVVFGQKVSDYKYISVPEKFKGFNEDYGLENFLSKALIGKKYVVISENKDKWPSEVNNPCSVAKAEVLNSSSFLKNKVSVQFKDCNDKIISETKGSSSIKEFETGYPDALKQALITVPSSNPTTNNLAIQAENRETITTTVDTKTAENVNISNAEATATKYSNGKITLQKIQLDNNQFILADGNSSVPYATFRSTTKKDVFRVRLANGESTIGYFENGNIIIEIPQANGEYSKEVFLGK
ncbi:hypothetical protein ACM39_12085 [Chryseobacterium sp. FH2]|uniref:hypothetical protein n=1 Tax=Chryseobacterium sp. FH2 TaxID=1674291 RepID=UPI00065AEDA8|nr:hypothetical protein [Chryseobacterium sp. FH2]KMQ67597.1 hypothetical protein ACM39_12085 [Chryseobacterium sp. FH2]